MPKKRKARRRNIPLHTGPVPLETPVQSSSTASPKAQAGARSFTTPARASSSLGQIQADYTHVVGDLKRIAVFGGGLIAVLIILSFFIR